MTLTSGPGMQGRMLWLIRGAELRALTEEQQRHATFRHVAWRHVARRWAAIAQALSNLPPEKPPPEMLAGATPGTLQHVFAKQRGAPPGFTRAVPVPPLP